MTLIADGLIITAALTAAIYCMILARRIQRLTSLDRGLGQAIAELSRQVTGMQEALGAAKRASGASQRDLRSLTARAEMAAGRLELLLASLHDAEGAAPIDAAGRRASRNARQAARWGASDLAEGDRSDDAAAAGLSGMGAKLKGAANDMGAMRAGVDRGGPDQAWVDQGRATRRAADAPEGGGANRASVLGSKPGSKDDPLRRRLRDILGGAA